AHESDLQTKAYDPLKALQIAPKKLLLAFPLYQWQPCYKAFSKLFIEELLWLAIVRHDRDLACPGQLGLALNGGDAHEGIYSLAATHLPAFRRYCEDSKYYLSPMKFSFNTAYVEGWGLYSEALGEELGIYETNLEMLGRYAFEMFRANRLVVDTGLHAFGWPKDKALQYMMDNCLNPPGELKNEVERYITWPGQACAYKIGEMKIWELRRKAEKALGTTFDIREFHHRILDCGAVPLDVLANVVDEFIHESKVAGN
ncbi:hypothetical protein ElyMa_002733400, partial [Elysia marginata]